MGIPVEKGAIAFAMTCGAGMSTCLGAAIVFHSGLVRMANNKFLAASLATASGVMLYVSFAEIMVKSQDGFLAAGFSDGMAKILMTLSFFCGIVMGKGLNALADFVSGHDSHGPVDLDLLRMQLAKSEAERNRNAEDCGSMDLSHLSISSKAASNADEESPGTVPGGPDLDSPSHIHSQRLAHSHTQRLAIFEIHAKADKRLANMGLQTAIAIGIHNFPVNLKIQIDFY